MAEMQTKRMVLWMVLIALSGVGAADTATALDADATDSSSSFEFRVCVPIVDIGDVAACSIVGE